MRPLALCLILVAGAYAQTPLAPNSTTPVTLAPNAEALFRIAVPAAQTLQLSLHETHAIAGVLTITDSTGAAYACLDPTARTTSAESLTLLEGAYTLRIQPAFHTAIDRAFDLQLSAPRPATNADRDRHRAEQLLGEGEQLYRDPQPGYLAAIRAKFEASVAAWQPLADNARLADALHHLGAVEVDQGEPQPALAVFQRELDLRNALHEPAGTARALHGLAIVYQSTGRPSPAIEHENQATAIWQELGNVRGQSESFLTLASAQDSSGQADAARTSLERAVQLAHSEGFSPIEAAALSVTGVRHFRLGEYPEAAESYKQALAVAHESNLKLQVALVTSNLGALYNQWGEPREALRYFEEALPVRKALASPGSYANTLYNVAVAHHSLAEYQLALDELNQALPIFHQTSYRVGEAYALQELASVYIDLKDYPKAESLLKQALDIRRATSDRLGESQILLRLAAVHGHSGDGAAELSDAREALAIAEPAGYQFEQMNALAMIGDALIISKKFQEALEPLDRELALSRKLGNKIEEAKGLRYQAAALRQLGDLARAHAGLEQALQLQTETGDVGGQALALFELAELEQSTVPADAEQHVMRSLDIAESLRANIGSRESRLRVAASHRDFYELAVALATQSGKPARALEIAERGRARGLLDLLVEAGLDLRTGVDPALLARQRRAEEFLGSKQELLLRLMDSPHSAAIERSLRKEIDQAIDSYDQLDGEVRAQSPAYAAIVEPPKPTLANFQSLAPADGALVEFWLGKDRSFAWVVTPNSIQSFPLPPRDEIEALVRLAHAAVTQRNLTPTETLAAKNARLAQAAADFHRDCQRLAQIFAAPLAAAHGRRLFIVADGALEYLPFAALPLAAQPEITMLPSATAAAQQFKLFAHRPAAPDSVAIFADPVFSSDDDRLLTPATRSAAGLFSLARLRSSRQEADAIAALAPHASVALDFSATRAAAESPKLARYRIVHFATHALVDNQRPNLSGIVLSMVDRAGHPQDGFLALQDIYNLRLNADLVVLSGCETALGEAVRAEGLVGLTRGFLQAGTRQVLASLWDVHDRATAELMRLFYTALLRQHLSPAAALRSAQLTLRKDPRWSDPYFWAPFVLEGANPTASH